MLYRFIYRTGVGVLFLSYSSSRGVWRYLFSMDSRTSPHAFIVLLNLMPNFRGLIGGKYKGGKVMPLFRVTVKRMKNTNGVRLEPGMHVEIPSNSYANPVTTNGGQVVIDAFYRIYGVDIKRAGAVNMNDLEVEKIG